MRFWGKTPEGHGDLGAYGELFIGLFQSASIVQKLMARADSGG